MSLTGEDKTRDLQTRLKKVFRDLLKPARVKGLVITKAERDTVRGYLLTVCPVERSESARDFEVRLAGNHGRSVGYAMVDGRTLLPRRTGVRAPRRRDRR